MSHVISRPAAMRWFRLGFAAVFGALAWRLAGAQQ
jgi:threonine/homoserine/homoserine lactone efflux protein